MRIIAGAWRSRRLVAPEGDATRPTADRVRETLFSMLASRIGSFEGLTVLDLFAGSGALALEALSRGAARAILVEQDPAAIRAAEANIRALEATAEVRRLDATRLPPAPGPFDLVFLDPPYGQGLVEASLASALTGGWIAPHALVAAETGRAETLGVAGLERVAERSIGKAMLHLLRPALPQTP
jgi:16S rRNA (guanine966-N2)-methyltransferase